MNVSMICPGIKVQQLFRCPSSITSKGGKVGLFFPWAEYIINIVRHCFLCNLQLFVLAACTQKLAFRINTLIYRADSPSAGVRRLIIYKMDDNATNVFVFSLIQQ